MKMNTEGLDFETYAVETGKAILNILDTVHEYEALGIRPPESFNRYAAKYFLEGYRIIAEMERLAMPEAAYEAVDGGLSEVKG